MLRAATARAVRAETIGVNADLRNDEATQLADWLRSVTGKRWSVRFVRGMVGAPFFLATGQGYPLTAETIEEAKVCWPQKLRQVGWLPPTG